MPDPFITLILPIRNESAYIMRGLHALIEQDYPAERIETLIVDGMSTDGTREIIREFVAQGTRISIHLIDNPAGIVPTGLNLALRQAKGDIVIRVDGHCIIAPDYVRKCVEHIQRDGVDAVGGSMKTIGETHIAKSIAIGMSSPFGVGNSAFRTLSKKTMMVDTVPFPAFTRQIIERAGLYDEELVRNQDDEYNYRIRELGGKILLAGDVHSSYFSRGSLKSLWQQYFQYGFWKVRVLQKHPLQMSLRQFVPPLFVLTLFASVLLFLLPPFYFIFPIIFLLYLIFNLSTSLSNAAKYGWRYLLFLPVIFAILHLSYGLGFLTGLFKFWNRWRDKVGKVPEWSNETVG
ncbi:MAG: glycosyltransferase family 2 protein [Anaerolineales bacterium]